MQLVPRTNKGICEICDTQELVVVYQSKGDITVCKTHYDLEVAAIAENKAIVQESRAVDSSIETKADVHLAKTVPMIELRAAVDNNPDVPADRKDYVYAEECMTRFQNLQRVIFEQRKDLLEKEKEAREWQIATQTAAGKLREEQRAKFIGVDISYQPTPVKVIKPKAIKVPGKSKKFSMAECAAAAEKYGVPKAGVQSIVISRGMSYEDAAKHLHGLINP